MAVLNLFFWFIFGALSGWTVALIARPEAVAKRVVVSGVVGALGGIAGGIVARYLSHRPVIDGFDGPSILTAVIAAVILASLFNLIATDHQYKE